VQHGSLLAAGVEPASTDEAAPASPVVVPAPESVEAGSPAPPPLTDAPPEVRPPAPVALPPAFVIFPEAALAPVAAAPSSGAFEPHAHNDDAAPSTAKTTSARPAPE
jgi:hypothetical protein